MLFQKSNISKIDEPVTFLLYDLEPVMDIRVFLAWILRIPDPGSLGQGSGGSLKMSMISIKTYVKLTVIIV